MTFSHIEWLLLLIAIPAIALTAFMAWIKRGDRWKKLVAARLQKRLSQRRPAWAHFLSLGLALLGLSGLIIALAQPESGEEWIEVESEGRNILFCIDISRSMMTTDVSPNRLLAARAAALEVLEKFPNDRVGILLFSGETLVQSPLTIDHGFIEQTLSQLEPDDIPSGGSDLTKAVNEGVGLLVNSGQRSNIMVIFSDGEKSSAGLDTAAAQAAESGVFIYALGFGGDGGFIPDARERDGKFRDRDGRPVFSKLDEDSLRAVADRTNGFYSRGMGQSFLFKLDNALSEMDRFEESGKHQRVAKPAHKWFLLGGLLFLMSSLIVRCFPTRSLGIALAITFLSPQASDASQLSDGREALQRGDYSEAHQAFESAARETTGERAARLYLAAGAAAYQGKDWTPAADSFSAALATDDIALQHEAHYGLATSLFQLGAPLKGEDQTKAFKGAVKHYQHALELQPDDTRAQDNLKAIEQFLLQEEQKKEEEPKQEDQKQDSESDDQKEDDKKSEDQQDQENQDKNEDSQKDSEEKKDPSEEPQDPKDQSGDDQQKDENQDPNEDSKPENGEGENNEDMDPKESEGQGNPGEENQDPESLKGESPQSSEDPGKPGDEKDMQNSPQKGEPQEPGNESPEERARRLLKQFSDFGGKPPRQIRRPFRRPAHDW